VLAFGGVELVVDGRPVELSETMAYKALMLSGVPNLIFTIGYTNASWTLKADLVSEYVTWSRSTSFGCCPTWTGSGRARWCRCASPMCRSDRSWI